MKLLNEELFFSLFDHVFLCVFACFLFGFVVVIVVAFWWCCICLFVLFFALREGWGQGVLFVFACMFCFFESFFVLFCFVLFVLFCFHPIQQ